MNFKAVKYLFFLSLLFSSMNLQANDVGTAAVITDSNSTIPVVDMRDYYNPKTRASFIDKVSHALQEYGFFAAINAKVSYDLIQEAYQSAKDFFALDSETKLKYDAASTNGQRGYNAMGAESAKGQCCGDFKEFYHVGRSLTPDQIARLGYWNNVWPDELNLEGPMAPLFKELERYMAPIQRAIAEAIYQESDFFNNMTIEGDILLRVIHYPAADLNDQEQRVWAAAHTDIDLMTILPIATAEGLEIQDKNGEWFRVVVPKDAFIVNAGDMLENITNGYFRSAKHRVVSTPNQKERYSMVLFVHPRSDDELGPLDSGRCADRWRSLLRQSDRMGALDGASLADLNLATPEMLNQLALSGLMDRLIEVGRASPDAMKRLDEYSYASESVKNQLAENET